MNLKRITAMILAACLLVGCGLTGCKKKDDTEMGRYTEKQLAELADVHRVLSIKTDENGDYILHGFTHKDGVSTVNRLTVPKDGGEPQTTEVSWMSALLTGQSIPIGVDEAADGTSYLLYMNEQYQSQLVRLSNGDVEYIDIAELSQQDVDGMYVPSIDYSEDDLDEPPEEGGDDDEADDGSISIGGFGGATVSDGMMLYPSAVTALENGEFLITYSGTGVYRYAADGTKLDEFAGSIFQNSPAMFENRLVLPDSETGKIRVFDIATGEETESLAYDGDIYSISIGLDAEGVIIADRNGVHRLTQAGTETVVDGGLTSLMLPTYTAECVLNVGDGTYMCILSDGEKMVMMSYAFDESVPAKPDKELNIFSLYDSNTIRQAIGEFQRLNPDVRVNLNVAISEGSSATVEDVIRTLNTELLGGNAPDLIVLDGLPVQSYIEKGVLADISELTERLISEEGLMRNIVSAYAKGDAVYAVPSRFTVPVMLGDGGEIGRMTSLSALADMVQAEQDGEQKLMVKPNELWGEEGEMLMKYYDACSGGFVNADGTLDETALAAFFTDMLRLDSVLKDSYPQLDNEMGAISVAISGGGAGFEMLDTGTWSLRDGSALVHIQDIVGVMGLRSMGGDIGSMDGMGLASLFNQGQFYPSAGIGITASGSQQELASQFIETLMSGGIQEKYLYDGFPVNGNALKTMIESELGGDDPVPDMGFLTLCEGLTTPVFVDEVVKNTVLELTSGLMDGTLTPEQAAQQVVEKTRLYLAE